MQVPEFVFEEEASSRRREWSQHLQLYCGGGYALGERWSTSTPSRWQHITNGKQGSNHTYFRLGPLAGGLVGVSSGLYKFVVDKPEIVTDTLKLKANRLLNTCGEPVTAFKRPERSLTVALWAPAQQREAFRTV